MLRVPIIFLLVLVIVPDHLIHSFTMAADVIQLINFASNAVSIVNGEMSPKYILDSQDFVLDEIANKIDKLSNTLEQMEENNEKRMNDALTVLIDRLPLESRVETGLSELHHLIVRIDGLYENFKYYRQNPIKFTQSTIMDFINTVLSQKQGDLVDIITSMHRLMIPGRSAKYRKALLELVHEKNQVLSFRELCGTGSSPQQRLYEIYRAVLISEARAFLMTIFSYEMLNWYKNVTSTAEVRMAASQFISRAKAYFSSIKKVMRDSSLIVDLCDPDNFKRDENFIELEGFMQMFVIYESEFWGTCNGECSKFDTVIQSDRCRNKKWCPVRSCHGRIFDCVSTSSSVVCELPPGSLSIRRYEWVKDNYDNIYGNPASCSGFPRTVARYYSWSGFCDVCICTCADETSKSPATRAINLRPQLSNIKANMVVTGAKFILSDKLIQIQIQEGKLVSGCRIEANSERWVEPENFEYNPNVAFRGRQLGSFSLLNKNNKTLLEYGKDFTFFTYHLRMLNLDDVKAPSGYIVTGVKIEHEVLGNPVDYRRHDGLIRRPLQLAIHVTKFDITNGILFKDNESSCWISQENMPGRPRYYGISRNEVVLSAPDNPTKRKGNDRASEPGECVTFTTSDRKKDAGQATVPFFDAQPAILSISSPLNGLGLIHRGAPGSGGFLALRLLTFDLFNCLKMTLEPEIMKMYS